MLGKGNVNSAKLIVSVLIGLMIAEELVSFFDKAYTVNTVYFWDDLAAGLTEIRRILKPGGTFVNAVYTKEFLDTLPVTKQGYAKHSIKHLVEAGEMAGFTVIPKAIVEGKAYCVVYQK